MSNELIFQISASWVIGKHPEGKFCEMQFLQCKMTQIGHFQGMIKRVSRGCLMVSIILTRQDMSIFRWSGEILKKKFNRVGVGPRRVDHIFYIIEFLKLFSLVEGDQELFSILLRIFFYTECGHKDVERAYTLWTLLSLTSFIFLIKSYTQYRPSLVEVNQA